VIGDGSINRLALQDMGAWPIRVSDSFREFMVKKTSQLPKSDNFPEDESGRLLDKHRFEKISKMVRSAVLGRVFVKK
jgi:hypothetical protein